MDKVMEMSLTQKVEILNKYLRLAAVAESYSDNKKVLSYIKKTIALEGKNLEKKNYPLIDEDARSVEKYRSELAAVILSLSKAKKIDSWRTGCDDLRVCTEKISAQVQADDGVLHPKKDSAADRVVKTLAGGAKKVGEKISDIVDTSVKQFKDNMREISEAVKKAEEETSSPKTSN